MDLFTSYSEDKSDVVNSATAALTNVCPIHLFNPDNGVCNRRKGFKFSCFAAGDSSHGIISKGHK
jgi:hypothetical protein